MPAVRAAAFFSRRHGRGNGGGGSVGTGTRERRNGARSCIGRDHAQRPRRGSDLRRSGGQECRRLRCVAARGGVLGNPGGHLRGVAQSAADASGHRDAVLRLGRESGPRATQPLGLAAVGRECQRLARGAAACAPRRCGRCVERGLRQAGRRRGRSRCGTVLVAEPARSERRLLFAGRPGTRAGRQALGAGPAGPPPPRHHSRAAAPDWEEAQAIIRKCVHCGFCNATCPTYQLLGDELDGPRGRIYLMKQVLEGGEVTRSTQRHLGRCLTCLNCQTTCPSGVEYGHLVDIGRKIVDARVERPAPERTVRWLLREGLTSPLFAPALRVGRAVRPLLPAVLRNKVPRRPGARAASAAPLEHRRKVLMLKGCVQPSMMPNIDIAAARVLDAAGIQAVYAGGTGCCGAVRTHLGDHHGGLDDMRRNIDAWLPLVSAGGAQAIVTSASACSLAIKEYGHALSGDAEYADKAARISAMACDLSELLPELVPALKGKLRLEGPTPPALHPPPTLPPT